MVPLGQGPGEAVLLQSSVFSGTLQRPSVSVVELERAGVQGPELCTLLAGPFPSQHHVASWALYLGASRIAPRITVMEPLSLFTIVIKPKP